MDKVGGIFIFAIILYGVAMVATQGATKYRRGHPYLPRYAQRCVA